MKKLILLIIFLSFCFNSCEHSKEMNNVKIIGLMSDVMWKGKMDGLISTDTISLKGTYGLGPLENLKGEVLVFDGTTYISGINSNEKLYVNKVEAAKSPFFVYATEKNLEKVPLPSNVNNLSSLEKYIDQKFSKIEIPFVFILKGKWKNLNIHSVNLPAGSIVSSPKEAHEGLKNFTYENIDGYIVGFFSRKHKTIFTHHD
ncbi:MAG: alpha-acetolactate decarboxylase, partial [Flavobacteriaceae bacterium]|nr:alpha-acetolactate decarboxylase [Flavobacteriaceae bacterium]